MIQAMRSQTLKQQYFDWLYSQITTRRGSYRKIAMLLHEKPFRWSVHNDDNRLEDGLELRNRFVEESGLDESHLEVAFFIKARCTCFEMMVALAQRIHWLTCDLADVNVDYSSRWFFEMIQNLSLDRFSDNISPHPRLSVVIEKEVDEILEIFLSRTYKSDGSQGGLFPIKGRPQKDLTKMELWYQVMIYLEENRR